MRSFAVILLLGFISLGGFSQTPKSKASSTKASGSTRVEKSDIAIHTRTLDEKSTWERVLAAENASVKAISAKDFLDRFPDSKFKTHAEELLIRSEVEEGYERLQAGDMNSATLRFISASNAAVRPVGEPLFTEVLSKLPANLYFRGAREEGLRIAGILEEKVDGNSAQVLILANFYLSIENGSKARQLAESVIRISPDSAAAYRTLGLAYRMDFQIDESAVAYEKALALEPESNMARRGLAEMKRSLGKADEAMLLFGEILAKDPSDQPARSGLILSTFEAGKRSEAEAEMAKSLETNPGNVILLAGAAYWYSSQGEGGKAVEFANKAIDADPRFIWSHIALARGYLAQKKPLDAEKTLLAARRFGNFPTLEYEIASSRLAAGFFRDSAEELAKSFVITDGMIQTRLGGRIPRSSRSFAELVGFERRASIATPVAQDTSESDSKLFALLELKQALASSKPNTDIILRAADQFVQGDDGMKLYRRLFVAGSLLDKKLELARAADIAQAAIDNVDTGLDSPNAATAILASGLYENRAIAVARGEYLNVPEVPRSTLSAIVRGRIEEISGWAKYQLGEPESAVIRLRRAVSVLPGKSAWWQSASWRLGSALAMSGKDTEALDTFIRTYKESGQPDPFRYDTIAALYRKVHGNTDELESHVGPDPTPPVKLAAEAKLASDTDADTKSVPSAGQIVKPAALPVTTSADPGLTGIEGTPTPTPEVPLKREDLLIPSAIHQQAKKEAAADKLSSTADPAETKGVMNSTAVLTTSEIFPPVVITIPSSSARKPLTNKAIPYLPNPVLHSTPAVEEKPSTEYVQDSADTSAGKVSSAVELSSKEPSNSSRLESQTTDKVSTCTITSSDESLTLISGSGAKAVIVGIDDDTNLDVMKGFSSSPENVSVRREPIPGIISRALYVIGSDTGKAGVYQVTFELPCGKKTIVVRVR